MAAGRRQKGLSKGDVRCTGPVDRQAAPQCVRQWKAALDLHVEHAVSDVLADDLPVSLFDRVVLPTGDVVVVGFAKGRDDPAPCQVDRAIDACRLPERQPAIDTVGGSQFE